jgi:hypothetical protein
MSGTMILPGVYINVLAEGLIAPGQVTVGNLGVVGTAAMGEIGQPLLLGSYADATALFGPYDSFLSPDGTTPLTLVRALEQAFNGGASTVYAMRVADNSVAKAAATLTSASGDCVTLTADSEGTWANAITVAVTAPATTDVLMVHDVVTLAADQAAQTPIPLTQASVASNRNRATVRGLDGTVSALTIVTAAPGSGHGEYSGKTLLCGDALKAGEVVTADYSVDPGTFVTVIVTFGATSEVYLVTSGDMLVSKVNDPQSGSTMVTASKAAHSTEVPKAQRTSLANGKSGEAFNGYGDPTTYDPLLNVDAHIILAAGQSNVLAGAALDAHCQKASTDVYKRDRIAVVGSAVASAHTGPLTPTDVEKYLTALIGNTLSSDRVVFVAPGIQVASAAAADQASNPITLPGSYTAAVIAGMLAALPPHYSLTNKPVAVGGLEVVFTNPDLIELVQNRVTAVEVDRGIRLLRGQTTDVGAFREITTRRIVDYAKYGVRSAAGPFIGLLNNDRVRSALRTTINSFLKSMLDAEMLVGYDLTVSATRDQQIQGIAQVTITMQPVFSINFIQVTMILS